MLPAYEIPEADADLWDCGSNDDIRVPLARLDSDAFRLRPFEESAYARIVARSQKNGREVLRLRVQGLSFNKIAREIGLTAETVKAIWRRERLRSERIARARLSLAPSPPSLILTTGEPPCPTSNYSHNT